MPQFDERIGAAILIVGIGIVGIGFLWFVVRAFRTRKVWGFVALLPVINLLFPARHWRRARGPVLVMLLGGLVVLLPYGLNALFGNRVRTDAVVEEKPAEDGGSEERITLTKADPAQYAVLRDRKTFAVIQWANPDVTDEHVEWLRGMDQLRELDLNSAAITDKSLAIIATLPRLETLRIGCPNITDEGFRQHILPLGHLKSLDLTGSKVKRSTAQEWTRGQPGRVRPNL